MFAEKYSLNYDVLNCTKPYKKEIDFVYRWAGRPKSIFDIGCGTATYWKFYPKGTDLFGVDRSRAMARIKPGIVCADITTYTHRNREQFDCATALFNVLNYIPGLGWFENIPIKKGGLFIFDIWDKDKVDADGFTTTGRERKGLFRRIRPGLYDGHSINLEIEVTDYRGGKREQFFEIHEMYVHSLEDIEDACGKEWIISGIKKTDLWQTWYRLKKR